jgi:hypothetical protein
VKKGIGEASKAGTEYAVNKIIDPLAKSAIKRGLPPTLVHNTSTSVKRGARSAVNRLGDTATSKLRPGRYISNVVNQTYHSVPVCSIFHSVEKKRKRNINKYSQRSPSLKRKLESVDVILDRDVPQRVICIYSTDKSSISTTKRRKTLNQYIEDA